MIFFFNSLVVAAAHLDVQAFGLEALGGHLADASGHFFLVVNVRDALLVVGTLEPGFRRVHRGPLALADVDEFVE